MSFRPDLGFVEAGRNLDSADFFEPVLRPGRQARPLPATAFRSLTFLKLEDEAIWTRQWVCIGLDAQIPQSGDLLPFTVGEHGIHVQRKADGGLIGRFNQAQHGGCRVVPLQCRGGTKTRCSFTSCGHSRDRAEMAADELGRQAPVMHQYLGLRPERLLKVPTANWGPLIFVNLDETPPDFAQVTADAPELGDLFIRKTDGTYRSTWLEFEANWKLVGQSLASGQPTPAAHPLSPEQGDAAVRSPWLHVQSGFGGQQLSGDWLFPNLVLLRTESQVAIVILQPTAIGKTLCRISVLPGQTGNAQADTLDEFWAQLFEQRGRLAEQWQEQHVSRTASEVDAPTSVSSELADVASIAPLQDPVGDWMQRTLARTILDRKPRWTDIPLFHHRSA